MSNGIGFIDLLVNEISFFIAVFIFVASILILFLKKNKKEIVTLILVILMLLSGFLLGFYTLLTIAAGSNKPNHIKKEMGCINDEFGNGGICYNYKVWIK